MLLKFIGYHPDDDTRWLNSIAENVAAGMTESMEATAR
jgi:hypothetical protein